VLQTVRQTVLQRMGARMYRDKLATTVLWFFVSLNFGWAFVPSEWLTWIYAVLTPTVAYAFYWMGRMTVERWQLQGLAGGDCVRLHHAERGASCARASCA
jgi:lipoprotein signal peptidase